MSLFRESHQRKAIVNLLKARKDHPSAAMIYEDLRFELPNLSLGTVYRNLEILEKQGRIRILNLAQKEARYDGQMVKHAHFICEHCGTIEDVEMKSDCCQMVNMLESRNYRISKFNLDITGTCPKCKEKL